jgi:hypothetical protein
MPVIPAFRNLRQEDHEFKASLGYISRPSLKKKAKVMLKEFISILKEILRCIFLFKF